MTHRDLPGGARQEHVCFEYISRAARPTCPLRTNGIQVGGDGGARDSTEVSGLAHLQATYPTRPALARVR